MQTLLRCLPAGSLCFAVLPAACVPTIMLTTAAAPALPPQQEVEQVFQQRGLIGYGGVSFYWIGLAVNPYESWPLFRCATLQRLCM